jgi:hypothetical protein
MSKPSKRRWAVEKRARRVLAQQAKALQVANRLMGVPRKRLISADSTGAWFYNSKTGAISIPKI